MHSKSIVVSYSPEDHAFHQESVREYTQGNALRLLTGRPVSYHAIAIVDTSEEADKAVLHLTRMQRVAEGVAAPELVAH